MKSLIMVIILTAALSGSYNNLESSAYDPRSTQIHDKLQAQASKSIAQAKIYAAKWKEEAIQAKKEQQEAQDKQVEVQYRASTYFPCSCECQ